MALAPGPYDDLPRFAPAPVPRGPDRHRVAVVGAGPVGLALAAGLARHGLPCVVLEPRTAVAYGSRAICLSRRSLEILDGFSVADGILARGLPWTSGASYWRGNPVLRLAMPHDADQRHPPMLNLQQCFTEQALVEALAGRPEVELRWGHAATAIAQDAAGVRLDVAAPGADYALRADWVVAADGARSPTRAALGLSLEGESHEGRYLIADIRLRSARPTERLAWFDPPSNPGLTVLMHRQPGDIWRVDYQLAPEEDAEAAQREDAVRARISAHLAAIGEGPDYDLLLVSVYRAHGLTLPAFRHRRVLLAGDAAHLLPIFGVRGLNSGIEDAGSLAWMLAAVARGAAPEALLDAWSAERVRAARENIAQSRKSTLFMTPPTRGHALMRDAALSLAVSQPWARALADPRQSAAVAQAGSALGTAEEGAWPAGTPGVGAALPSVPVERDGRPGHLLKLLGPGPTAVLARGDAAAEAALAHVPGLRLVRTGPGGEAPDRAGRAAALLGLDASGAGYLLRPDGIVAWRWRRFDSGAFRAALARTFGRGLCGHG